MLHSLACTALVVALSPFATPTVRVAADPPAIQFFVVDFAPVGEIPRSTLSYYVTIVAESNQPKPLNWEVDVSPDKTPKQIRDRAFRSLTKSSYEVKLVGDTKILFYGCKSLTIKTEAPGKKEIEENCRPTVKVYNTEADALAGN